MFNLPDAKFELFRKAINSGAVVRAIMVPETSGRPRSWFNSLAAWFTNEGAGGLSYVSFDSDGILKGPIAKFIGTDSASKIKAICSAGPGSTVFFVADKNDLASRLAGKLRIKLAQELKLIDNQRFEFCWIIVDRI